MSQAFDSLLSKIENYYSDADYTVQDAEHLSRIAISEYATTQNALVASARHLSVGSVQKIIDLTIDKHITADPSDWMLFAANAVDNVINYAQRGVLASGLGDFTDFLPVGHPSRTNRGAMTASALNDSIARWTAADPRIASDQARYETYKAYSSVPGSVEADYASFKLSALVAAGYVPEDISLPITAAFRMSFAMRSAMSKALAAVRRRHRDGRFAEEFGRLKGFFSRGDGSIFSENGRIVGAERGTNNFEVEFSGSDEIPDGIYSIDAAKTDSVKAVLSERAVKGVKAKRSIAVPTQAERDAAIPLDEFLKTKKDAPEGWTRNEDGSFTSKSGQTLRQVDARPEGDYMFEGVGESGAEDATKPFFELKDRDGETIGVAQDWAGANKIAMTYDAFEEDSKPEEDAPGLDQDFIPSPKGFKTSEEILKEQNDFKGRTPEDVINGKQPPKDYIPSDPNDFQRYDGSIPAARAANQRRAKDVRLLESALGRKLTEAEKMQLGLMPERDSYAPGSRADRINLVPLGGPDARKDLKAELAGKKKTQAKDAPGLDQDAPGSSGIDIEHASNPSNWRQPGKQGVYESPDGRLSVELEGDPDGNYLTVKFDGEDLELGDESVLLDLVGDVYNYPDNRMSRADLQKTVDKIAEMLDEAVKDADAPGLDQSAPQSNEFDQLKEKGNNLIQQIRDNGPIGDETPEEFEERIAGYQKQLDNFVSTVENLDPDNAERAAISLDRNITDSNIDPLLDELEGLTETGKKLSRGGTDLGPDLERTDWGTIEAYVDRVAVEISKAGDKWQVDKSGFEDIEQSGGDHEYQETKLFDSEQEAIAEAKKWLELGKSPDYYDFMYNDWFDGQADGLDQDAKNPNWFDEAIDFDALDNQDNWKDLGGGSKEYTSPDGKLKLTFEPDGDSDGEGGLVDASGIAIEYDGQSVGSFKATERDLTSPGEIADALSRKLAEANFNPNDLVKAVDNGEYEFIPANDVGSVSIAQKYSPNTKKLQWEVTKEARDLIDENLEHSYFEQKKFDSLDDARAFAEEFAQILNDDSKISSFLDEDFRLNQDGDYGFDQASPSIPDSVKQLADGYNISPRMETVYNSNTKQFEREENPSEFEADGDFYDFGSAVVNLSEYAPGKWLATVFYGDNDGSGQNVLELEQDFNSPEEAFEWTANGFNKQFDNSQVADGILKRNNLNEMLEFYNSPKYAEADENYQEEISGRLSMFGFDQAAGTDEIKTSEGGNASYKGPDGSTGSIKSDGSGTWEGSFTDAEGESFTRKFKAEDKAAAWLQKKVDDSKLAAFKKANDGLSPKQLEPATSKQYDLLQELFDERDDIDPTTSDAIKDALDNRNLSKSQISALFGDLQKKPFKEGVDPTKPTDRMLNSLQGYLTTKQISPEEMDDILSQLEAGLDRPGIEALTNKLRRKPDSVDAAGLDQAAPFDDSNWSTETRVTDSDSGRKVDATPKYASRATKNRIDSAIAEAEKIAKERQEALEGEGRSKGDTEWDDTQRILDQFAWAARAKNYSYLPREDYISDQYDEVSDAWTEHDKVTRLEVDRMAKENQRLADNWMDLEEDEKEEIISKVYDYFEKWAENDTRDFYAAIFEFAKNERNGSSIIRDPLEYVAEFIDYKSMYDFQDLGFIFDSAGISASEDEDGFDQDAPTKPLSEKQLEPASDAQYNYLQSLVESKMDVDADTAAAVAEAATNKNLSKAQAGALIGKLRPLADKENAGQFGKPSQKMIDSVNRDVYAKGLSEEDRNEILKDLNNLSKGDVSSIISQLKEMPNVPGGLDNYIKKLVEDGDLEALKRLRADVRNEDSFSVLDRAINSLETGEDAGLDQAAPSTQASGPLYDRDEASSLLDEIKAAEDAGEIGNTFLPTDTLKDFDPEDVGDAASMYVELDDAIGNLGEGSLRQKLEQFAEKLLSSIQSRLGPVEAAKRDSDDIGSELEFDRISRKANDLVEFYYPSEGIAFDQLNEPGNNDVGDSRGGGWEARVALDEDEEEETWVASLTSPDGQSGEQRSFDNQEDAARWAAQNLESNNNQLLPEELDEFLSGQIFSTYANNPQALISKLNNIAEWYRGTRRGDGEDVARGILEYVDRLENLLGDSAPKA